MRFRAINTQFQYTRFRRLKTQTHIFKGVSWRGILAPVSFWEANPQQFLPRLSSHVSHGSDWHLSENWSSWAEKQWQVSGTAKLPSEEHLTVVFSQLQSTSLQISSFCTFLGVKIMVCKPLATINRDIFARGFPGSVPEMSRKVHQGSMEAPRFSSESLSNSHFKYLFGGAIWKWEWSPFAHPTHPGAHEGDLVMWGAEPSPPMPRLCKWHARNYAFVSLTQ